MPIIAPKILDGDEWGGGGDGNIDHRVIHSYFEFIVFAFCYSHCFLRERPFIIIYMSLFETDVHGETYDIVDKFRSRINALFVDQILAQNYTR